MPDRPSGTVAHSRSRPNSPALRPTVPTTIASSQPTAAGTSYGEDQMFTTTPGVPPLRDPAVTEVHSDRAIFHGEVNPNGAARRRPASNTSDDANFQQSGWANAATTSHEVGIGMSKHVPERQPARSPDCMPDTLYHYRAVGTNEHGQRRQRRRHFHDLCLQPVVQRSLPQRPCAPADRRRPAARLPRLRAGLRRQYRTAMTSSPTWSRVRLRLAAIRKPRIRSGNPGSLRGP